MHYQNPKIVVGSRLHSWASGCCCAAVRFSRGAGFWTIPAGYLELGERAEAGALREAWEEARARIELEGLLAVYSVERIGQVQLLYRARLLDEDVAAGPESLEVRLVGWDEMPWDELAFPTVRWILDHARSLRGDSRAAGHGGQSRCAAARADAGRRRPVALTGSPI